MPAGATEPPDEAPEIRCELRGVERAPADSGVDYRISNLQSIRLSIVVDKGDLRLPEFYAIRERVSQPLDSYSAVTVELADDKSKQVPVKLEYSNSSIAIDKYERWYRLVIPLSEEEIVERYEYYRTKILELAEPEDRARLEEIFEKPTHFQGFRRDAENVPGVYKIGCTYESSEPGYWNGEVQSETIFEIYYEMTFVEWYFERHEETKSSP